MTDQPPPERSIQEDEAQARTDAESDDAGQPLSDSMQGSAYGGSSAESGGNYDTAGPTTANTEGDPMDAEEETSDEPSPS
jgi:hypothetical protein